MFSCRRDIQILASSTGKDYLVLPFGIGSYLFCGWDMPFSDLSLLSGNSNRGLAEKIAHCLGRSLSDTRIGRFSDGEIRVEIHDNIRGRDVFLIQSTCAPCNDNLMELLILADACKRASSGRITAVLPYYGYARQDRKVASRAPITAKLVADLITAAGVDRVLTVDLHAGQIQGFFDKPVDNLFALPLLVREMEKFCDKEHIIVSPDAGGVERARSFAKKLDIGLAIVDKRRSSPNEAEVMHLIGNVQGKKAILVDDMIDTAGTLTKAAEAVMVHGAQSVMAVATHAVLSGPAIERINMSPLDSVLVTDSIPLGEKSVHTSKIETTTVAALIAEAIYAIHNNASVSRLFY